MSSTAPIPLSHSRIDEIEVLRAIAILFTLIHHAFSNLLMWPLETRTFLYSHFTFWSGVDVFFVVSGFVIARDFFLRQKEAGLTTPYWRYTLAFWVRRAFRILPSAWLWLGLFLFATVFINETYAFGTFDRSLNDTIAAVFQYANYHQYQCFERLSFCGANGIYWSLSLEEQFYILLPFLIFASRRFLPAVLILGIAAQFFIPRPEWSLAWSFRTDGFLWGVLLAIWSTKESYLKFSPKFLARFSVIRWPLVISLLLASLALPAPPNKISWGVGLLAMICTVMVWLASYGQGYLMKPGVFRNILVWIGSRSYALYLTHIFAFHFTVEIFYRGLPRPQGHTSDSTIMFLCCGLSLTLVLSELNYRFIETPLRKWGRKYSDRITNQTNLLSPRHEAIR